ncbi:hypothetical protein JCM8547_002635 [Rhodosporidiobolus lusitaniae]
MANNKSDSGPVVQPIQSSSAHPTSTSSDSTIHPSPVVEEGPADSSIPPNQSASSARPGTQDALTGQGNSATKPNREDVADVVKGHTQDAEEHEESGEKVEGAGGQRDFEQTGGKEGEPTPGKPHANRSSNQDLVEAGTTMAGDAEADGGVSLSFFTSTTPIFEYDTYRLLVSLLDMFSSYRRSFIHDRVHRQRPFSFKSSQEASDSGPYLLSRPPEPAFSSQYFEAVRRFLGASTPYDLWCGSSERLLHHDIHPVHPLVARVAAFQPSKAAIRQDLQLNPSPFQPEIPPLQKQKFSAMVEVTRWIWEDETIGLPEVVHLVLHARLPIHILIRDLASTIRYGRLVSHAEQELLSYLSGRPSSALSPQQCDTSLSSNGSTSPLVVKAA